MSFRKLVFGIFLMFIFFQMASIKEVHSQNVTPSDVAHWRLQAIEILRHAVSSSNQSLRQEAFVWLSKSYIPELAPLLQEYLRNLGTMPSHSAELELVQIIDFFGHGPSDPAVIKFLLELLKSTQSYILKLRIALSLARLQAQEVTPILIEWLQSESTYELREQAALALGILGGADVKNALLKTLSELTAELHKSKENPQDFDARLLVRRNYRVLEAVVKSLASLGEPQAVTAFVETLDVLDTFAPGLSFYGYSSDSIVSMLQSIPQQFHPKLSEAVRPLLGHSEPLVRIRASLILNAIGNFSSTKSLIELINLAKISSIFVKFPLLFELFYFALANLVRGEELVPPIVEFIGILKGPISSKEEADMRKASQIFLLSALGSIATKDSILQILKFLKELPTIETNPNNLAELQLSVIIILGRALKPASDRVVHLELLIPALASYADVERSTMLSSAAIFALGNSEQFAALPVLVSLLFNNNGNTDIKRSAIFALGALNDVRAVESLATLFGAANKFIEVGAAGAIMQILHNQNSQVFPINSMNQTNTPISLTELPLISKMMLSMRRALPK